MKITVHQVKEKVMVVRLEDRLDAHTAPILKEKIAALVGDGVALLIVNLAKVDFIDSSGLAALVSGMKRTRLQGGNLKLVAVQSVAMRVFELTLLDRVFEFYPDEEAAVASFSQ